MGTTSKTANFEVRGGFLFYPTVTAPSSVSATAGNGQVALSWTASTGALGWVVSGYNVGRATASGGPYTYVAVGNVTSSTRTGLTNGTTYYFVIRAEDALGISIATSSEVSATPVAPAAPPPTGGEGGVLFQLGLFFRLPLGQRTLEKAPLFLPPPAPVVPCDHRADLNCDNKIDLRDLSIFLFVDSQKDLSRIDFNRDEILDAKDLSILLSDWSEPFLIFEKNPSYTSPQGETMRQKEILSRDTLAEQFVSVGLIPSDANTAQKQQEPLAQLGFLYTQAKQSVEIAWSFTKDAVVRVYMFIRNLWHAVIY